LGSPRRALVVTSERNANLWKSFRNFPGVLIRTAGELCAMDVLNSALVIAEVGAMRDLAGRVGAAPVRGGE
jgi:ribosomal protein L4